VPDDIVPIVPVDWVPVDCVPVDCVPVDWVPVVDDGWVPVDCVPEPGPPGPLVAKVPLVACEDDVGRCTPPVPGPVPPEPPYPPAPELVSDEPAQPSSASMQMTGAVIRVIFAPIWDNPSTS